MGLLLETLCTYKVWIVFAFITLTIALLVFIGHARLMDMEAIQYACKMAQETRPMPPPMICP